MKPDASIILITDASPLGRARAKVLTILIGSPLRVWPPAGLAVDKQSQFRDAQEFWVSPEAVESIVLRFDRNHVFRMPRCETRQTWGWYLSRFYPDAVVRFLLWTDTLPAMFTREPIRAVPEQFPFSLSLLQHAFHDMKYLQNPRDCKKAAMWISSLAEPELLPFKFLAQREHWEDWHKSGWNSKFRRLRVRILGDTDVAQVVVTQNAVGFWQAVCAKYQEWATGSMSDTERTELANLVQVWQ